MSAGPPRHLVVARSRGLRAVAEGPPIRRNDDQIRPLARPIDLCCTQQLLPQLAGAKYKPLKRGRGFPSGMVVLSVFGEVHQRSGGSRPGRAGLSFGPSLPIDEAHDKFRPRSSARFSSTRGSNQKERCT